MKISIVTVSYNQSPFLEQCICSVIKQDYPNIEYIVVDPGSRDGSRKIIERYAHHVDKIIFQPDSGPADGLNKGFAEATGDIFGFINADDALLPGALTNVAMTMKNKPDIDVVCGHIYQVDEQLNLIRRLRATFYTPFVYVYGGVQTTQQGTFIRKCAFKKTNGFNPNNKTSWDAELLLDIALTGGKFFVLNKYLAIFRVYKDSISGSGRFAIEYENDLERYFQKVIQRPYRKSDRFLSKWYRIIKWSHDPIGLLYRICDALLCPYIHQKISLPHV
jgi:glycosyltransferase involved in cell wall biosynthesis